MVSIWTFCRLLLVLVFRANKKPQQCDAQMETSTKNQNEQCNFQMKTSTKNQNEQRKAKTSNQRHLPVLVSETVLILSQKRERTTKSSINQPTAKGNTPPKPKRATKSNKEHFSFPFSFICFKSGPMEGGWHQE